MTTLVDRPTIPAERQEHAQRLTGMQALVRLLHEQAQADRSAGLRTGGFVSGYPGSPVGKLTDLLEDEKPSLARDGIHHQPGLNEELSATAVWGSQTVQDDETATVDGVFAMWYGKAPGVDRAGDALHHGVIRGAAPLGGVLLVAGDDPKPNATVYPSDSTPTLASWGVPVFFPGDAQEVVDLGLHAYALSRACSLWTAMKMVTDVADGSGVVEAPDVRPIVPTLEWEGRPFSPTIRPMAAGAAMVDAEKDLALRQRLAAEYVRRNDLNPVEVPTPDARIGIVAPGKAYQDLRAALRSLGLDEAALTRARIRVKKVSVLTPISAEEWASFAEGLDTVIIVEEKRPFLEVALKEALYGMAGTPRILGKSDLETAILPWYGQLTADVIAARLRGVLGGLGVDGLAEPHEDDAPGPGARTVLPLSTARTGFFCSGCPHSTGLKAPEGSKVGAGIGCHILEVLAPRDVYGQVTGYTQMGGEGAQWLGIAPFVKTPHIFQNLGDGTFHHSGSLAVRWAVASGATITYKLLYNGTVGMTGGQDIQGSMSIPDVVRALRAEGVKKIAITTDEPAKYRRIRLPRGVKVHHRRDIVAVQESLAVVPGVTVLIHDQQCAADRRRHFKEPGSRVNTRIAINERVCEGCGDCNAKSQCLSVQPLETEFGRKTTIHQSSCNLDYSCADGDCPSFMVIDTSKATKPAAAGRQAPTVPTPIVATRGFSAYLTGIGGTGVISVGGLIAEAAIIEGLRARTFDLTGATVKAGPVASHVQVYAKDAPEPTATIADGGADVVLAFDLLTLVGPGALAPLKRDHTVVVASSSVVPTAQMAVDSSQPYPPLDQLRERVDAVSRAASNRYLDVQALAERATGSHLAGNALLLGYAVQTGALPLQPASVEEAIRRSGVAVEQSLGAFAWGRAVAADPSLAEMLLAGRSLPASVVIAPEVAALGLPESLARKVSLRLEDLTAYQNRSYAQRYLDAVAAVARRDREVHPDDLAVTALAAEHLHRMMAYKDEYEVARLHASEASKAAVAAQFGQGARISWKLQPPLLKGLGLHRKVTVGPWFRPAFVALAGLKAVRGTALDPFGHMRIRRIERLLADDMDLVIHTLSDTLRAENYLSAVELLSAADRVRGYEDVKIRNVQAYLRSRADLSVSLGLPQPDLRLVSLVAGWTWES